MNTNALSLIEQLIERTKNEEISWKPYSNEKSKVKPLYSSLLDSASISSAITRPVFLPNGSYFCTYNNGCFFLLLYQLVTSSVKIELRAQTNHSTNSKLCASSSTDDSQVASQLKRLYNLVESKPDSSEIDEFINSFIQNE